VREQGRVISFTGARLVCKYGIDPQEQDLKEGKLPDTGGWEKRREVVGKINSTINVWMLKKRLNIAREL